MNRRTVALVALAVAAVGAAVVLAAYWPLGPADGDGTGDEAETPRFVHDGGQLTLEPTTEQTISGETELDAGTELQVRLRSSGENPFLKSATTTVDDSGAFEATFDVSDVDEGTTFDVVVHRGGDRIMNTTGEVVA